MDVATADVVVGARVDELARCGVRDACVCPGSRSTPIAIKLAQHAGFKVWMHLDERSAAFFGLGAQVLQFEEELGRYLGAPHVIAVNTGTAMPPARARSRLARSVSRAREVATD